jgi:UDP-glucuronate decarboxylase
LGSHLCEKLLSSGHLVTCLDNFYTGSKKNIEHLVGDPKFRWVGHDVITPYQFEVDQIYNLACPASPVHHQHEPINTMKCNVLGAINALDLADRNNARVLQASTSEVYGDPMQHPQSENYWGNVNPIGIRSCYDEAKRCAETLFIDYHRKRRTDIKVARIFNTYGPRMDAKDGRVVSNFIVQALIGEDLTVYSDGKQTRSFCFVDDLIDGLIALMESPRDVTGPINIGNPHEFTVLKLAEKVLAMTGSRSKLVLKPLPLDDPRQRRPDISKAKTLLAWTPKCELDEGLQRTVSYFRTLV